MGVTNTEKYLLTVFFGIDIIPVNRYLWSVVVRCLGRRFLFVTSYIYTSIYNRSYWRDEKYRNTVVRYRFNADTRYRPSFLPVSVCAYRIMVFPVRYDSGIRHEYQVTCYE